MSPADCYLQIYPLDDVIPINEAGEIQDRFPGALVIGGDMLAYDFRRGQSSLVLLSITGEDWSDAVYQAPSFS